MNWQAIEFALLCGCASSLFTGVMAFSFGAYLGRVITLTNPPKEPEEVKPLFVWRTGKFRIRGKDNPEDGELITAFPYRPFTYEPPPDEKTILDGLLEKIGYTPKAKRGPDPPRLEEMTAIVSGWGRAEAQGVSQKDYCKGKAISVSTLHNYMRALKELRDGLEGLNTSP